MKIPKVSQLPTTSSTLSAKVFSPSRETPSYKDHIMSVQDKIKTELLQEAYANIDKIYDSIEQHFVLDETRRDNVIKHLNLLKDELYFVFQTTPLS